LFEDGSPVVDVRLEGFIPTKTGVLVHINKLDGNRGVYHLENGKTLKLILENERIVLDYRDRRKGYYAVSENIQYFCTQSKIMAWNNTSKPVSDVTQMEDEESWCRGSQVGDKFYFSESINSCEGEDEEEVCVKTFKMSRVKSTGGGFSVEEIDSVELSSSEYMYTSDYSELGDSVVFSIVYDDYSEYRTSVTLAKIPKEGSLEISEILTRTGNTGYVYLNILNNGNLVNNKLLLKVSENEILDEPAEIRTEDTNSLVYTTTNVERVVFLSTDGNEVSVVASPEPSPAVYFSLFISEEGPLLAEYSQRYYNKPDFAYPFSYTKIRFLNTDLELMGELTNTDKVSNFEIHNIKGVDYISDSRINDEESKTTVYQLPTSSSELVADRRFTDLNYRSITFLNFYDKVLFKGNFEEESDAGSIRSTVAGFFGNDGIVRLINKIKAAIGIYDT